eukprot:SAG25_NODE_1734_length_2425_cov_3.272884_2_plen_70_part_00
MQRTHRAWLQDACTGCVVLQACAQLHTPQAAELRARDDLGDPGCGPCGGHVMRLMGHEAYGPLVEVCGP